MVGNFTLNSFGEANFRTQIRDLLLLTEGTGYSKAEKRLT